MDAAASECVLPCLAGCRWSCLPLFAGKGITASHECLRLPADFSHNLCSSLGRQWRPGANVWPRRARKTAPPTGTLRGRPGGLISPGKAATVCCSHSLDEETKWRLRHFWQTQSCIASMFTPQNQDKYCIEPWQASFKTCALLQVPDHHKQDATSRSPPGRNSWQGKQSHCFVFFLRNQFSLACQVSFLLCTPN